VDASVGGKTGVDLGPFKNQVGVFSDARAVYVDTQFLSTLDKEQLLSGFAEIIKHSLITGVQYWESLKSVQPESDDLQAIIRKSVEIKRDVVAADHKEEGERKKLNFGHTIGHAIEGFLLENGNVTLHGYAVAWGMITEAYISHQKGMLSADELDEITYLIRSKFPSAPISKENFKRIIQLCYNDKKNHGGIIRGVLLSKIGQAEIDQEITDQEVLNALNFLLELKV
jgi:3-dehydroquinate synthase